MSDEKMKVPISQVVPQAPFPKSCQDHLTQLGGSPTFAMSLGAKELFHTNFLAFLLECEDPALNTVRTGLITWLFDSDVGPVVTWRERSNFDLVIVPRSCIEKAGSRKQDVTHQTIAVVIEAKLKSVPSLQQLKDYDSKLKSGIDLECDDVSKLKLDDSKLKSGIDLECDDVSKLKLKLEDDGGVVIWRPWKKGCKGSIRRVLLAPKVGNAEKMGDWHWLDWIGLTVAMEQGLKGPSATTLVGIAHDYKLSLCNLLEVVKQTGDFVKEALDANATINFGTYYQAITNQIFRNHRIHDLVGKYASRLLELHVASSLKEKKRFRSATLFTRQQPGVEFEWCVEDGKKNIRIGVQVQGTQYRHFVSIKGGESEYRKKALDSTLEKLTSWFTSEINGANLSGKKNAQDLDLYVYDSSETFRYTQTDIRSLPLCNLKCKVENSLKLAENHLKDVQAIFNVLQGQKTGIATLPSPAEESS